MVVWNTSKFLVLQYLKIDSDRFTRLLQFGPDGKPKNYNLISTAESELHNINGKQAGYKAATTTLDDDGKVSTYSIHTP